MRDLARKKFTVGSSSKLKLSMRVIFVILLVFATVFIAKNFLSVSIPGTGSVTLNDAPKGLTPVNVGNADKVAKGGVDLKSQTVKLTQGKVGAGASGQATRSFGGGSYGLSVEATIPNIKGFLVEVWLVDSSGNTREVDFMSCTGSSCSYSLKDTDKYSKYSTIWITKEITKEDEKPEEHILEGTW